MIIEIGEFTIVEAIISEIRYEPDTKTLYIPPTWIDTIWIMNFEQFSKAVKEYGDDIELLYAHGDVFITHGKRDFKDFTPECIVEIRIEGSEY